jgi:hypothetical protein
VFLEEEAGERQGPKHAEPTVSGGASDKLGVPQLCMALLISRPHHTSFLSHKALHQASGASLRWDSGEFHHGKYSDHIHLSTAILVAGECI